MSPPPEAHGAGRKGCEKFLERPGLPAKPEEGPGPGWLSSETLYAQPPAPARKSRERFSTSCTPTIEKWCMKMYQGTWKVESDSTKSVKTTPTSRPAA